VSEQGDHVIYRVLVFDRDGTEILLTRSSSGLQLPEVSIPEWERVAENVTCAVERQWGEEVVCLFDLNSESGNNTSYVIARHWRTSGACASPLHWIPVKDLSGYSFDDQVDYAAMQESLARCRTSVWGSNKEPFAHLGWLEQLCKWVGQSIAPRGIHLTGKFRQLNASPTFSLIRFETNGPAVWFKAVGEPNRHEFRITLKLAQLFPKFLPEIIRERPQWNAWLSFEAKGRELCETSDVNLWETTAALLGQLQVESLEKSHDISCAVARTLKTDELASLVRPFFDVMRPLMKRQTNVPPSILTDQELSDLEERVLDGLARLRDLEIPNALGHLDPNPGNIVVSSRSCVFLDWAEAHVGNPFFTFQYLLEHARRVFAADPDAKDRLIRAYAERWKSTLSPSVVGEALKLSPLLAPFVFAAGNPAWRNEERLADRATAGYLRSLTRRMHREANELSRRRPLCLC
jgi:hypothetical protein